MLGTFLDRATQLLGPRYVLTAWAPTFVVVILGGIAPVATVGWSRSFEWWADLDGVAQAAFGLLVVIGIGALAYVLQSFPLIRAFEGYGLPRLLKAAGRRSELARWQRLKEKARPAWYTSMPKENKYVMPTRLGNVMAAAETYPKSVYGMDGVFWWPRLAPYLPAEYRATLDESLFPVVALINAAFLLIVASLLQLVWLVLIDSDIWVIVLAYSVGMALAFAAYRAASKQSLAYGQWVRSAFDLYRHELWKGLRLQPPPNVIEERKQWDLLQEWTYNFVLPSDPPLGYTGNAAPEPPAEPQGVVVTIRVEDAE